MPPWMSVVTEYGNQVLPHGLLFRYCSNDIGFRTQCLVLARLIDGFRKVDRSEYTYRFPLV